MGYHRRSGAPRKSKKCWCGSGKKQKNCHGDVVPSAKYIPGALTPVDGPVPEGVPALRSFTKEPKAEVSAWGVPGEEHKIFVAPMRKEDLQSGKEVNLKGSPGPYRVQFLMSRPGYPITKEREHAFIDKAVGTSHIRIVKPKSERRLQDADRMLMQLRGLNFQYECYADDDGFLGKIVAELTADDAQDAENKAYGAIAPFLSAWSLNLDVPVHVETIQVTDLTTYITSLRTKTPHFEMNWGGSGELPFFLDEFCQYASVYREGLNTNSLFYRFLCFFKIIESIIARRGREAAEQRAAGKDTRRGYEVIPEKKEELLALLKRLYSWRDTWDAMAIEQIFPKEVLGKKVTWIKEKHLYGIRCGIAHALLEKGEITIILDKIEHIQQVNK
jgi:hypothetical protein